MSSIPSLNMYCGTRQIVLLRLPLLSFNVLVSCINDTTSFLDAAVSVAGVASVAVVYCGNVTVATPDSRLLCHYLGFITQFNTYSL